MTYLAALLVVAGVALYVASPLIGAKNKGRTRAGDDDQERLIHERSLAVQALGELDFDREMSKVSVEDYRALRAPLEARALGAMAALERLREERRAATIVPKPSSEPVAAPKPNGKRVRRVVFCPQCGARIRPEGNFCVDCGSSLSPVRSLAAQAE